MPTRRPLQDPEIAKAIQQLKIRVAEINDRQKLFEFRREALETEPDIWLPDELDLNMIRRNTDQWKPSEYPNDFIIIAEFNGKIIGFLHLSICYRLFDGGPSAWIEDLFVLKKFRGYKVGTKLVEFAREIAEKRGCKTIRLIVGLENMAGLSFYRKCGFKISKIGLATIKLNKFNK
jgi:ribosomal protein S18 acetylase RimI-like enzyme